jgi:hypothetical protein
LISARKTRSDFFRVLRRARARGDEESIHELRKTAARLRCFCETAGQGVVAADLRWFRRAASDLRDMDIVLDMEPPAALADWLRRERERKLTRFRRTLRRDRVDALRSELARLPDIRKRDARDAAEQTKARARERGAELGPGSEPHELHALRRALRRLRFQRQWIGRGTKRIEKLLDALGELNDLATARRLADQCPARAKLGAWRSELDAKIRAAAQRGADLWERH